MNMLAVAAQLEQENRKLHETLAALQSNHKKRCSTCTQTNVYIEHFNVESVSNSAIKNLFQYYTRITYLRFLMLISFVFPSGTLSNVNPVSYDSNEKEVKRLPVNQQVFLFLCRIRNGLQVKDLASRFNIKIQSVSTILKGLFKYMYLRIGSLSYWPYRSVIIQNMPSVYWEEFPNCVPFIDCTESKIHCMLCQSQCYS